MTYTLILKFSLIFDQVPDRDEFECQLYWCNVLHPSINHDKFTKEEDAKILKLAKKYKNHNWEKIAQELNVSEQNNLLMFLMP